MKIKLSRSRVRYIMAAAIVAVVLMVLFISFYAYGEPLPIQDPEVVTCYR